MELDLRNRGINWTFFAWALVVYGIFAATALFGWEIRLVSCLIAFAACAGLTYRLGTTWSETSVLVHALTSLLVIVLMLGGFAQAQILAQDLAIPNTWVTWPSAIARASTLLIVVKWPKWTDRHYSPLLRMPPANVR